MGQQAVAAPLKSPLDARPEPTEDDEFAPTPEDMLPALEEHEVDPFVDVQPMKKGTPLASKEDIAKIQSIPLPASQQTQRTPAVQPVKAPSELEAHLAKMGQDETSRLDQEIAMSDADQEAMAPVAVDPRAEKLAKMESLLSQLQKNRSKNELGLNLLRAGNQIAQGFAMGSGAKITDGSEAVNALEKQLDQPIKDYADRIADQEDDPGSDISTFMRQQAYAILKKLSPETDYTGKLENMSANQLKKLPGLKNALSSSGKANTRYVTVQDDDGTIRSKLIDMETGEVIKDLGKAGYAYSTNIDPVTGQAMRTSKSDPFQASVLAPPLKYGKEVSPEEKAAAAKNPTVGDYRAEQVILPKEWDTVVTKDKEGFESAQADKLKIMSSLKGIEALVDEAKTNPNSAASLGGIVGSLFDPGKQTDEDAKRFVNQAGLVNKYGNIIKEGVTGVIDDDLAQDIKATAQAYGTQLDKIVRTNAKKYADNTKASLINGRQVDTNVLADFYYSPDKSTSKDKNTVWLQGPSGEKARMTKEAAAKYLKKPGYKIVK